MSLRLPAAPFRHLSAAQSNPIILITCTTTITNTKSSSFLHFSLRNCSSDTSRKLVVITRCCCSFKRAVFGVSVKRSMTSKSWVPIKQGKLVIKVKEKLEKDYYSLPTGKNGRDDEEMILWFLKDRRFQVDEAISKLTKAIKWRQEFGVSEISEESVRRVAATGKSYLHDSLDVNGRPVLIVDPSKHVPEMFDRSEDERLCVFLLEKALSRLPEGKEEILGIFDLRGFTLKNSDLKFLTFLFDVLYVYYPRRLGQVLFVDAPFVFQPIWQLAKPLVKSYASLVRFCSADDVRKEYFTESTLPASFRQ